MKIAYKGAIITLAVLTVILSALFLTAITTENTSQDEVKLRLKWVNHAQFAGYYTAEQKDYYKENGINVQIIPGGASSPSIQMVASGSEHFGVTAMSQLMEARAKGVPVVALATIYRKNPLIWFSVNEDIKTAQDFVGRKVGVTIGSNSDVLFRAMLVKAGVDIKDVETVPVSYDLTPLLTGQVDVYEGYIINQPLIAQGKGFQTYIVNPEDYGIYFYADTLFTTEDMIKNNPELVKRFVQASIKGWEYAFDNPNDAVDFTLMYSDQLTKEFETKKMDASLELIRPDDKPVGTIDREVLKDMYKLLIENDILEQEFDLDELYTTEFQ